MEGLRRKVLGCEPVFRELPGAARQRQELPNSFRSVSQERLPPLSGKKRIFDYMNRINKSGTAKGLPSVSLLEDGGFFLYPAHINNISKERFPA